MKIPVDEGTVETADSGDHIRIAAPHTNMTSHVCCRWKTAFLAANVLFLVDNRAKTSARGARSELPTAAN
jgi:hypothetical protein